MTNPLNPFIQDDTLSVITHWSDAPRWLCGYPFPPEVSAHDQFSRDLRFVSGAVVIFITLRVNCHWRVPTSDALNSVLQEESLRQAVLAHHPKRGPLNGMSSMHHIT